MISGDFVRSLDDAETARNTGSVIDCESDPMYAESDSNSPWNVSTVVAAVDGSFEGRKPVSSLSPRIIFELRAICIVGRTG